MGTFPRCRSSGGLYNAVFEREGGSLCDLDSSTGLFLVSPLSFYRQHCLPADFLPVDPSKVTTRPLPVEPGTVSATSSPVLAPLPAPATMGATPSSAQPLHVRAGPMTWRPPKISPVTATAATAATARWRFHPATTGAKPSLAMSSREPHSIRRPRASPRSCSDRSFSSFG